MIGSGLDAADLASRMASQAASAITDDAAAVPAVIEACGDRLAAADVAGVASQYTGNAAVVQPELETVAGSQQPTATDGAALENMRLDVTFRFDDITVKDDLAAARATSQGTITIRATAKTQPARLRQLLVLEPTGATARSRSTCAADAGAVRRGLLRHLASPQPGFGHVRSRLRSPSTTRLRLRRRLPARTGVAQADVGVTGAVRVPALGAPFSSRHHCSSWAAG